MVSGLWRRLRSLFPAESPAADRRQEPAPSEPPSSFYAPPEPPRPPVETAPTPPPPEPPRSVEQLAESFGTRLVEDEALRGSLTDDEFQPLLDWANARLGELATSCASLPQPDGSLRFGQAGNQLLDLLRTLDLAIGERAQASPDLALSRFQLLDTLLAPPLFEESAASVARARLDALLAEPIEQLRAADGADLAQRLAEALG